MSLKVLLDFYQIIIPYGFIGFPTDSRQANFIAIIQCRIFSKMGIN